jgi:hypothetical protein
MIRARTGGRLLAALVLAGAGGLQAADGLDPALERLGDPSAREVVHEATLVRPPLPLGIKSSVAIYEFLLDRPAFAAAMARHLHPPLERYTVVEKGRGVYEVDDGGTIRGEVRLLAKAADRRVYLANGQARSMAQLVRVTGRAVILLEYRPGASDGDPAVDTTSHIYFRVDGGIMQAMVKLLSPLIGGAVDRRIANLGLAARIVAERIARDPGSLYEEMQAWPDLRRDDVEEYRRTFLP